MTTESEQKLQNFLKKYAKQLLPSYSPASLRAQIRSQSEEDLKSCGAAIRAG